MKQLFIRRGAIEIQEVASPQVRPGFVLINTSASCISAGTELSTVSTSSESLIDKARRKPELIKRGIDMVLSEGLSHTIDLIKGKLESGTPSGYSLSGTIISVGEGIDDLVPGQRVAAAGAGYANHAEIVSVPRNLVVPIPDGVSDEDAASVTLGAIAMQGVRRALPTIGESCAIIGLGLLGQIALQILKASGIRVIGFDLDPARVEKAREMGIDAAHVSAIADPVDEAINFSGGYGVDFALITAATKSSAPLDQALDMCRRKGRVVIVGDVGLSMQRNKIYPKELDVLISTSYGPGRYDDEYEEGGHDYPIGYVRWTENRNMEEFLRLVLNGDVKIAPLIGGKFPLEQAAEAYSALSSESRPLLVLLDYPKTKTEILLKSTIEFPNPQVKQPEKSGIIKVGIIGAGNFATSVHLPNLKSMSDRYSIYSICDINGPLALSAATRFEARKHGTNPDELISDAEIDLVMITTRHDEHAKLAMAASKNGKAVFCEKPMGVNRDEVLDLAKILIENKTPYLVGFNRRFSPAVQKIRGSLKHRSSPVIMIYTVNAGYLNDDHWTHGASGGGRIVGEACHMIDVCSSITGSKLQNLSAQSISPGMHKYFHHDNVQISLKYEDGSIAQITYMASGAPEYPKERLEVHCGGSTFVLDDYRSLSVFGPAKKTLDWKSGDKGHYEELMKFSDYMRGKSDAPISLESMVETTLATFAVYEQIGFAGKK